MNTRIKNIIVTFSFIFILSGFMILNISIKDSELSNSERRKLKSIPEVNVDQILNGEYFSEHEHYLLDQFVLRNHFRSLKAISKLYLFNQMDNNRVYIIDNGIYKMEYPLNEKSVYNTAKKLNRVSDLYLEGMNVYYAIIPDKNYFIAEEYGYISMDYEKMEEILNQNVSKMEYIDLFDTLTINNYYRTDLHWSQDQLLPVTNHLLIKMGNLGVQSEYIKKQKTPFYGSYYGQSALPIPPDYIHYLTNETIENAIVYDFETKTKSKVYNHELFTSIDPYNFFLSGPKSLITVENPNSTQTKELILFRDSFGSSIAPLFIENYSKITLVDLRYISTEILGNYIDFSLNQDVLFLYSTPIINNSFILK